MLEHVGLLGKAWAAIRRGVGWFRNRLTTHERKLRDLRAEDEIRRIRERRREESRRIRETRGIEEKNAAFERACEEGRRLYREEVEKAGRRWRLTDEISVDRVAVAYAKEHWREFLDS